MRGQYVTITIWIWYPCQQNKNVSRLIQTWTDMQRGSVTISRVQLEQAGATPPPTVRSIVRGPGMPEKEAMTKLQKRCKKGAKKRCKNGSDICGTRTRDLDHNPWETALCFNSFDRGITRYIVRQSHTQQLISMGLEPGTLTTIRQRKHYALTV
jgi:hypothetical protein